MCALCLIANIITIHGSYSFVYNGSLSCQSIIDVELMEWLSSNGEVITSLTDARKLNLTFAPVNTSSY